MRRGGPRASAGRHRLRGGGRRVSPATVLPEIALLMGEVPLVPYGTRGRRRWATRSSRSSRGMRRCCSPITARLTWGPDARGARIRMESLEHAARILLAARTLGTGSFELTREQMRRRSSALRGTSRHGQTIHRILRRQHRSAAGAARASTSSGSQARRAPATRRPAAVRSKVRADYEARLAGVIEQLRGHCGHDRRGAGAPSARRSRSWTGERRRPRRSWRKRRCATRSGSTPRTSGSAIREESDGRLARLRRAARAEWARRSRRLAEVQALIGGPPKRPSPRRHLRRRRRRRRSRPTLGAAADPSRCPHAGGRRGSGAPSAPTSPARDHPR